MPVPDRFTVCGLPGALSATVTAAARLPTLVGEKVTMMLQLPPAGTELPQVLVAAKSLALAPVTLRLVMLKGAFPVLLRVTVWTPLAVPKVWAPKVRLEVLRLTAGPPPAPLRLTAWWPSEALSVIVSVAVRVPVAVGVKVTLIVQLAPPATELPQLLVWAKSPALVPARATLVTLKLALPVFVRVTGWAELLVPKGWLAKVKVKVESAAAEDVPVPARLTIWGLLLALLVSVNAAVRVPAPDGRKVTRIVHWAPAATVPPQLSLSLKSPALAPVMEIGGV